MFEKERFKSHVNLTGMNNLHGTRLAIDLIHVFHSEEFISVVIAL